MKDIALVYYLPVTGELPEDFPVVKIEYFDTWEEAIKRKEEMKGKGYYLQFEGCSIPMKGE